MKKYLVFALMIITIAFFNTYMETFAPNRNSFLLGQLSVMINVLVVMVSFFMIENPRPKSRWHLDKDKEL